MRFMKNLHIKICILVYKYDLIFILNKNYCDLVMSHILNQNHYLV